AIALKEWTLDLSTTVAETAVSKCDLGHKKITARDIAKLLPEKQWRASDMTAADAVQE
ncbi:MAG: hypothetical protein Q9193_002551, partial [Seirophora villosa]